MTVYVVCVGDPVEGGDVWVHGVYQHFQSAKRVFDRLSDETHYTVRLDTKRLARPVRRPRQKKKQRG